jgi:hypothetical protein
MTSDSLMRPPEGNRVGQKYLQWAREMTAEEAAERMDLLQRLPAHITDVHTHANGADAACELSPFAWTQVRSSFPEWSLDDSAAVTSLLYGDRSITRLWIAQPYHGINHRAANRYLLEHAPLGDMVALCGLPDDPVYTTSEIQRGLYAALKMYPHYREPPYQRLAEYFPDWCLSAAQAAGLAAIVHLPLPLSECVPDVISVARRFPHLKIVLAHLGRQMSADQPARIAFQTAARCQNVAVDTSMRPEQAVHELALQTFGPQRVIFGSDEPFNLLRYVKIFDRVLGRHNVSQRQYHWVPAEVHRAHADAAAAASLLHFQVIRAILAAVARVFPDVVDDVIPRIFDANARAWLTPRGRLCPG